MATLEAWLHLVFLICLVVRVGLGVGFLLVLFLSFSLCNNVVMNTSGHTKRTII
jgi:hypothetical protein